MKLVKPTRLVIFDFDKTFIRCDSFKRYCWFAAQTNGVQVVWLCRLLLDALKYLSGRMDGGRLKLTCLNAVLTDHASAALKLQTNEFVDRILFPKIYSGAIDRLHQHKEERCTTIFLSASPDLYVNQFGARCGADRVICTKFLDPDGNFTGKELGPNCRGDEKKRRLLAEYPDDEVAWDQSYGYGNSVDDVPFLELLGNPVAVNPESKLRKIAVERHWAIETWV